MSIPAHIAVSLQNLLTAQQALENVLADISEPNKQTVQRVVEIIKKEILLLAEQYPIIKDFSSLPGINIIPAINLLLLLQIEKAKSPSSLWKYCGVASPPLKSSTTQRLTIYAWNSPSFFQEKDLHILLFM